MKISVVIVTDAMRQGHLQGCLNALREQHSSIPFEVLVVLSGVALDLSPWQADGMDVRIVQAIDNNYCTKRNSGAREARGKILAYLDDDARCREGWVDAVAGGFREGWKIAGGRVEPCFQAAIPTDLRGFERFIGGFNHLPAVGYSSENIVGCNMFMRRDWLLRRGGFDEFIGSMNMTRPRCYFGGDETELIAGLAPEERGFIPEAGVEHTIGAARMSVGELMMRAEGLGRARRYIDCKQGVKTYRRLDKYRFLVCSYFSRKNKLLYRFKYHRWKGYLAKPEAP